MKNDKFCNNPLKPHCSAPCIEPHHQFIPLWGAEGITDATGATCSPHCWPTLKNDVKTFVKIYKLLKLIYFLVNFYNQSTQKPNINAN